MTETSYPRDLVGYGRNPPHPRWPNEARICVQFVINYEEGGENNILHGDRASEAFLSEIVGAAPWPGQRHMSMESIYEYGSRAGFWRLWRMFTERGMPVTVFGVATALHAQPGGGRRHEGGRIGRSRATGSNGSTTRISRREEERAHHERGDPHPHRGDGRAAARLVHGPHLGAHQPPRGGGGRLPLHAPIPTPTSCPIGRRHGERPQLIVPYTLDANDMRFATPQGFNSGDQFFAYLKDSSTRSMRRARPRRR